MSDVIGAMDCRFCVGKGAIYGRKGAMDCRVYYEKGQWAAAQPKEKVCEHMVFCAAPATHILYAQVFIDALRAVSLYAG